MSEQGVQNGKRNMEEVTSQNVRIQDRGNKPTEKDDATEYVAYPQPSFPRSGSLRGETRIMGGVFELTKHKGVVCVWECWRR